MAGSPARSTAERQVRLSVCKGVADRFDELQNIIRHGGDLGRLMDRMAESVMEAIFHPETRWAVKEYWEELEATDERAGAAVARPRTIGIPGGPGLGESAKKDKAADGSA